MRGSEAFCMSFHKRRRPHPKSFKGHGGEARGGSRHTLPHETPKLLFEDDEIVVVVKPAGLATANVPRGESSLFAWVRQRLRDRAAAESPAQAEPFLGVVSRLDQPVSGVVVFARTRQAAASLSAQFRDREVEKTYHALVEGRFPGAVGAQATWRDLLERPPADDAPGERGSETPQEAEVVVQLLARGVEVSLVRLRPRTGRRHQLRVQLGSRKCPIVGDRLYGSRLPFPAGIGLHSSALRIEHPATGQPLTFRAAWPAVWQQAARGLALPKVDEPS